MKTDGKILIVDDNKDLLTALRLLLIPFFSEVRIESNPNQIPSILSKESFDIILLDMNFSAGVNTGNEGLYWMKKIHETEPDIGIVFITAYGDVELAVRSMKEGAIDFIQKSWEEEKILSTILSAFKLSRSIQEIKALKNKQKHLNQNAINTGTFCLGKSDAMKKIMDIIDKVAATDANVLILGESGTGKEVIAREIHRQSKRKEGIFVNVNITSISESLFESEMFGHVKGAFTDAKSDRAGRFEIASGGSLFLDEIADLSMPLQSKLLAAIQNREIVRVGSHKHIPVDIRLISATNKDIFQFVDDQKFREDLLYRINTIQIEIPPLRERRDDIPVLADFFLEIFADKYGKDKIRISQKAQQILKEQPWYGNVRELQHLIEKSVIMCDSSLLTPRNFLFDKKSKVPDIPAESFNLAENEKRIIQTALDKQKGNVSKTAKILGINRSTLYEKIKKYDI